MKVIVGGRQTGKTEALIRLSAETQAYIVCHSQREAARIVGRAEEMGLAISMPITYDEFLNKRYYAKGFLVDNADMLLSTMTTVPIYAITVNKEEE